MDARIARSLRNVFRLREDLHFDIHITRSPVYDRLVEFEGTHKYEILPSFQQLVLPTGQYSDVLGMVGHPPMQAFPQPPSSKFDRQLEIAEGSCNVEKGIYHLQLCAESLHFHHVSSCATIYEGSCAWDDLRVCRVERSPKLEYVFNPSAYGFFKLETLWASDLLTARWIWSKGVRYSFYTESVKSFKKLQHLHLRSCPRLRFVLPVWVSSFPSMETLHIINCGELRHVFELDRRYPEEIATLGVLLLPKLTTIHLHDLPKLQNICDLVKMVAPRLETIKIRGCWSLRRLPYVGARGQGKKKPSVEIEKDVWDALEWDADHRPDHFETPVHSRYYKEKLPRVSVLR